jgi:hypothetical protein
MELMYAYAKLKKIIALLQYPVKKPPEILDSSGCEKMPSPSLSAN